MNSWICSFDIKVPPIQWFIIENFVGIFSRKWLRKFKKKLPLDGACLKIVNKILKYLF